MTRYALTTFDNPYDPFDNFDEWLIFDMDKGYNSCAYLGRITKFSDTMSEEEESLEVSRAIDEIIKFDPFKLYKKIEKTFEDSDR